MLIRIASWFVPRGQRAQWIDQWHAELYHRSRHIAHGKRLSWWSTGAFRHALYLFREELNMDILLQDLRFALRSLRTGKGLVAVAVLSVGLGIGAVTTIFTAVDAFLLRPLPIPEAEKVVLVHLTNQERGWSEMSLSPGDFEDLRERSQTLDIAIKMRAGFNVAGTDQPERLRGALISANYFDVFGLETARGRLFERTEENAGEDDVVLISDGLWHRHFGGAEDVVGNTLLLDNRKHVVVGVMPRAPWLHYSQEDVWKPFAIDPEASRGSRYLAATARLRPGASLESAERELESLTSQLALEYPADNAGVGARLESLRDGIYDEGFRLASIIASVAVALVLLIACANTANLLLTRATARSREVAVRGALGAGRGRIVKQFLAEAILIAGMGGLAGVGLAWAGVRSLRGLFGNQLPQLNEVQIDLRVLAFCVGVTMLTGLLFGLSPALKGSRAPFSRLRQGSAGVEAPGARLRRGLVIAEVALSLTLLVSSALLIQGYFSLSRHEPGFDHSDVLSFRLTLPENGYSEDGQSRQFYKELHQRLSTLPGVLAVGATSILPGDGSVATYYSVETSYDEAEQPPVASFRSVLPGYFEAMDIPLVAGQLFDPTSERDPSEVVIVNQTFARRHWSEEVAVGKTLEFSRGPKEIVAVVADSRDEGLDDEPEAMLFFSALSERDKSLSWLVETTGSPEESIELVTAEVHALDPNLPLYRAQSLSSFLQEDLADELILPKIMIALAVLALLLALGGVYGVMAFLVGQRTRELGIRLALGATRAEVQTLVLRQGTRLTMLGVVIGLIMALAVSRGLVSLLWEVSPFDLRTFTAASLALLAAGAFASWLPARRATRIEPMSALRSD